MSDALPTEWVVGEDTYALRTFKAEDGSLTYRPARRALGGRHMRGDLPRNPMTPSTLRPCRGAGAAFMPLDRRTTARSVRGVGTLHGRGHPHGRRVPIEGDNGVRAGSAQIVAWWCAEDAPGSPGLCGQRSSTRRFYDRDVRLGLYPAPPSRRTEEENRHGRYRATAAPSHQGAGNADTQAGAGAKPRTRASARAGTGTGSDGLRTR